jgi:hypothetical protein
MVQELFQNDTDGKYLFLKRRDFKNSLIGEIHNLIVKKLLAATLKFHILGY